MPVGICAAVLYLCILLHVNPYTRKQDDALALLAQVEIFLLLLSGNVIANQNTDALSQKDDLAVSVVLIGVTIFFLLVFMYQGFLFSKDTLLRWRRNWTEGRQLAKKAVDEEEVDKTSMPQWGDDTESGRATRPTAHVTRDIMDDTAAGDATNFGGVVAGTDMIGVPAPAPHELPSISSPKAMNLPGAIDSYHG